jgi:hypothetical protein
LTAAEHIYEQLLECIPESGNLEPGQTAEILVKFLSHDGFESDEFLRDTGTPVEIFCDSLPTIFQPLHVQVSMTPSAFIYHHHHHHSAGPC